jgi:2-polyprenyl-6-methoxyphenol hydroxylase-like FAD-dependent oxidoreductase
MDGAVDVLVVGAGPTGLMLANELRSRGVGVRIVDQNRDRARESRALVVHARSLELLDRHGLADVMVDRGRTTLTVHGHADGREMTVQLGDIGANDTRFPFLLFLSQAETEAVLADALEARGVSVERETTLTSFVDDGQGVTATLRTEERESTVRARFVVGCDGAHSTVRHALGLSFEGARYAQDFFLADVDVKTQLATDELHFFLSTRGLLVMFPFKESNFVRLVGSRVHASSTGGEAPTLEELTAFVEPLVSESLRIDRVRWSSFYRLHHRAVERFRVGHVFVAGDAAHIHSPAGGQGMNTGLQDAVNLGWKLADVVRGRASEALLDSYQAERAPVAKWLLRYTDRLFTAATTKNPVLVRLRNGLVPRLLPRLLASAERRRRAFRVASQLSIRYRKSPIVGAMGGVLTSGPRPGDRMPDVKLERDGTAVWLSEVTRSLEHFVVVFDESGTLDDRTPDAIEGLPVVHVTRVAPGSRVEGQRAYHDRSGDAFRRFGVECGGVFVVRPDRYIGVVGPRAEVTAAVAFAKRLLGG